jgi:hypothetical protein
MNKIRFLTIFLMAVAFFTVLLAQAQSDKQTQPGKINQKAVTKIEPAPTTVPQRAPVIGSQPGYQMVTDVLDGFGGGSESDNYKIPVNSGGQASVVGISVGVAYGIDAGFVYASHVKHGDASANGLVDMGDAIFLLNYLFRGGTDPCPMEAGDTNCNGLVDLGDAIFLLNYLFKGGPAPSC